MPQAVPLIAYTYKCGKLKLVLFLIFSYFFFIFIKCLIYVLLYYRNADGFPFVAEGGAEVGSKWRYIVVSRYVNIH